ncbi:MAG: cell surface protein [Bacteroidetes bacterium]|nr:cell surface protein [Bacteroidota bacterium]
MKKLLLIFTLFCQMSILFAQNPTLTVSGQVLDAYSLAPIGNHPVDVFVMFDSLYSPQIPTTVVTASDGSYLFSTPFIGQTATIYLSTLNFFGIPSAAMYQVTNSPINQVVTQTHTFYINNDSIVNNCMAYYAFAPQYPDSLTVQFTDQSIYSGNGVNYDWTFGDGTYSNLQNPVHTFPQSGYYQICLTIYDSICQNTYCDYIFVGNPYDTINPTLCSSLFSYYQDYSNAASFSFFDLSDGNPDSWLWDFGDGATSTIQHPNHYYSSNGLFVVSLTISNSLTGCTSTYVDYLYVDTTQNPSCMSSFSWQPGFNGTDVEFYDFSVGNNILTWFWDFGDGTTSTIQNPVHTYSTSGIYNVCLTIMSSDSCISTWCEQIATGNNIDCYSFFTYSQDYSNPYNVVFLDLSAGTPDSWYWDFGDGTTSTLQNPQHTYLTTGIFVVTLTMSNSQTGCNGTYSEYIMIDTTWITNCMSAFSWQPGNNNNEIQFLDFSMGNNIQSWVWSFGDGTSSTLQNPLHQFSTEGIYQVCLTITSADGCSNIWCEYVQVGGFYPCSNYFTYVTTGNTVLFDAIHSTGGDVVYDWYFGDGTVGTGQQVTHTFANPGTYYVSLMTTDTIGCVAFSDQVVVVGGDQNFNQVYGQVFAGNMPVTNGFVLLFSDDSDVSNTVFYDVVPIDQNGVYTFAQVPNGEYYILAFSLENSNYIPTYFGDQIDWQEATLVVLPSETVLYNINLVSANNNALNGNSSINGIVTNSNGVLPSPISNLKVLLYDENHLPIIFAGIQNGNSFNFNNLPIGQYYIKPQLPGYESEFTSIAVTQNNQTINVMITVNGNQLQLGVNDASTEISITGIYPNPASDVLKIAINSKDDQPALIKIIDTFGKTIIQDNVHISTGENLFEMNVTTLTSGIYIVNITSENGNQINKKLIKQ